MGTPARNAAAAIRQDVLEHLTDPDRALYTIVRALKPGGELILACSNPASPKGIVSKLTPHWFHRFVYKRGWFGYTFVDDPAYPPFKTYMRWSIQPSALRRTLSELGFTDIDLQLHDFRRFRWLGRKSEIRVRARKA